MVRLALYEHDARGAARLLAALPPPSSRRTRVERAVLWALSVFDRDVEQANTHLAEALVAGQPEWLIRTIIDLSPDVHKLLVSYPPTAGQEAYVEALLAGAGRGVAPARTKPAAAMVDPLTPRELTVLRYLCSRLTYPEIAAALYVSPNTLKSHVRTVYRKVGATSRDHAVEAGRSLRLM
jgi:LuxR family maltose regulon positive regulatory protein